jgi:hypothetical protein
MVRKKEGEEKEGTLLKRRMGILPTYHKWIYINLLFDINNYLFWYHEIKVSSFK